jgi:hypothetical protein
MHWGSFLLGVGAALGPSVVACWAIVRWQSVRTLARPVLRLVGKDVETPQEDCRNALQFLSELEREALKMALFAGSGADLVVYDVLHLIAFTRGRVWAAIEKLEGRKP